MSQKVIDGLKTLNVDTDAQWTQDGLVNLTAFKFVIGGEAVTREQLEEIAPGFNRGTSATYFDEKTSESSDPAPSAVTAATTGAGSEQPTVEEGAAQNGKASEEVPLTFVQRVRLLLQVPETLIDVSTLSAEDLEKIISQVPDRRNELINIREVFEKILAEQFNYLVQFEEAFQKTIPVENHADIVKRVHIANAASRHLVDQPRLRQAPIVPPLVRK